MMKVDEVQTPSDVSYMSSANAVVFSWWYRKSRVLFVGEALPSLLYGNGELGWVEGAITSPSPEIGAKLVPLT